MKAGAILFLWVLAADLSFAQDKVLETSPSSVDSLALRNGAAHLTSVLEASTDRRHSEIAIGKNFKVGGPLVRLFKVNKIREIPKRFWNLINPFGPPESEELLPEIPGVSLRAWSTTAGWHPGASAFPDPRTHEGGLGLISVGR